jgi:ADP-ribose pyrophosphatase YjhB (NUDIX family)
MPAAILPHMKSDDAENAAGRSAWLSPADWRTVQSSVPVACVDVIPVRGFVGARPNDARRVESVGLILRDTPHQGRRWCLVGGRMFRNESFAEAIARQLLETLGPGVTFDVPPDVQPAFVAQYFTEPRPVGVHDPRQHALGHTFVVPVAGDTRPQGEAHDFRWFPADALPPVTEFGFGQERVVAACLHRAGR